MALLYTMGFNKIKSGKLNCMNHCLFILKAYFILAQNYFSAREEIVYHLFIFHLYINTQIIHLERNLATRKSKFKLLKKNYAFPNVFIKQVSLFYAIFH